MDLPSYFRDNNLIPKCVIHVGGTGEEIDLYTAMGFRKILVLQSDVTAFEKLRVAVGDKPHVLGICVKLSRTNGYRVVNDRLTPCRRLDSLLVELGVHPKEFSLFVSDEYRGPKESIGADETAKYIEVEMWSGNISGGDGSVDPFIALWQKPHGRFAYEIFQHFFATRYALRNRLRLRTPPWAGQNLFGIDNPLLERAAPSFEEHDPRPDASELWRHTTDQPYDTNAPRNVCLFGNFQFNTGLYSAEERVFFRNLYSPVPALKEALEDSLNRMMRGHKTLVAIHIRRGDYKENDTGMFYRTPVESYKRWLAEIWPTLDTPLLYIASDDPQAVAEFAEYFPVTFEIMALPITEQFYVDFWVLSQADALAISNSSFSFAAAMLNQDATFHTAGSLYRVRPLRDGTMRSFDPWDDDVLLGRYDYNGPSAEEATDQLLMQMMPALDPGRSGILLEVGCGSFGWTFSSITKMGFKAHAVEPFPTDAFIGACKTTETVHTKGVLSEIDGEVPLYVGNGTDLNSLNADWWGVDKRHEPVIVHSFRLDTFLRTRDIKDVTCLKLDVEGAEERIIRQLQNMQSRLPHIVVFEYGGTPRMEGKGGWTPAALASTMRCLEVLIENGYYTFHVVENRRQSNAMRVTDAKGIRPEKFFAPDADYGNIIAIHDRRTAISHAMPGIPAPL